MAIDYGITARELVKELGGDENIINVTHCATRLRFILKDMSGIDSNKIKKIPGVITTVIAGGQYQVVIGNHVDIACEKVLELVRINESVIAPEQKVDAFSKVIDIISSIFAPFLYTLAACGILQGILGIFIATGLMTGDMGTYKVLNFISWTAFTFLPVLIAITAAKKFKVNEFIAVVIACALISPDYMSMVNSGESLSFLGINIQMLSYTSSVIPVILAIWAASYVEKFFVKVLPTVLRNLFTPMFTIAIMVPLTLLVFGPFGSIVGGAIGGTYNFLYGLSPIVAGVIVGGLWQVLVIFGVHWGITPVTVGNYATLGYDTFTGLQASAVFGQAGAALGVFFKTKDKQMKQVSLPAAITAIFGITEPSIYGVNLRLKKPMIYGCIAGAIGGGIAGAFNVYSWAYNMPGIATIPAFFKEGYMTNFIGYIISIVVSFVVAIMLTVIFGFRENNEGITKEVEEVVNQNEERVSGSATGALIISGVAKGEAIPLNTVKDEVFASEAMGKGVGVIPREGKLYAPCDGEVEALFPTQHAIGITSSEGIEILLHIGIDTVGMNGNGFKAHIQDGATFKKGDLLISFSIEEIEKAGYETTIIAVVTNSNEYSEVIAQVGIQDSLDHTLLEIIK